MAGDGPIPMIDGSTPEMLYPETFAKGLNLLTFTASSLDKIKAAAPSQIP